MKKLNNYITEAWSGVKQQSIKADIEAWCEEMRIPNYTINSKNEIDVKGDVDLRSKDFEELPYKFGHVNNMFSLSMCENLTSLKNCPDYVGGNFSCTLCSELDSLEGCPKKVKTHFYCYDCKKNFTEKEVKTLCKVTGKIIV